VQIGDLMYPITMATALENGFTPDSKVPGTNDQPLYWPVGSTDDRNRLSYVDQNNIVHNWPPDSEDQASGAVGATVTLREAMERSINPAVAALELDPKVTPQKVYDLAESVVLPAIGDIKATPALTLGASSYSPLVMANAYATFAASGFHHEPVMVTEVLDASGKVIWQGGDQGTQAVAPVTASQMTDMLHSVLTTGTASTNPAAKALAAKTTGLAGKTSTTDHDRSAWFGGYDGQLSTAVAVFRQAPSGALESLQSPSGARVSGNAAPTSVWAKFMELAAG